MDIEGTCDERFAELPRLLHDSIERGDDLGASVAIVLDGEPVVDIWGGWKEAERQTPWERDTITNVWSTTKTMTALAALVLVSRGELDVRAPVTRYWPEFGAGGKERVEVRHLLSHTSGVAGWDPPFTLEDIFDARAAADHLAAQEPWWEPGSASGYHGINQGHLVGEVIRRITGTPLGRFFAEEIAGPLGADFHIGLDPMHDLRVAEVIPPPPVEVDTSAIDPTSPAMRFFTGPPVAPSDCNRLDWRRAEIGAANGQGNARSVARIQSVVSHGGEVDGIRLLTPEAIEVIFDEQSNGIDLCLGIPLRFGVGYALVTEAFGYLPDSRICFWGGWGGSLVINDVDRRMTFAYMMNKMEAGIIGGTRADALLRATYGALGVPVQG